MKKIVFIILMSLTSVSIEADEYWTLFKTSDVLNFPFEITIHPIVISNNNEKSFLSGDRFFHIYNDKEWTKIVFDNYPKVALYSIAFDDTTMWIGGDRHLFHYDGKTVIDAFNLYELFPEWRYGGYISSVAVDDSCMVWMAFCYVAGSVDYGGIVSFDGKNFVNHTENLHYISNFYNIVKDNNNHIWVTSDKGVFYYDRETWSLFNAKNVLPSNVCGAIAVDQDNVVWVGLGIWGSSAYGVVSYDSVSWTLYNTENSGLVDNRVACIAVDQNNVKWIGTYYGGVSRFDGKTWTTINSQKSGLPKDSVFSIGVEKNNTIWFGMLNYIAKYTGEVIESSIMNETKSEAVPTLKAYPNPFNPSTTIEFTLPEAGFAALTIYNMAGQKIRELADVRMTAGTHRFQWDGKNDSGGAVSAGVYVARLKAGKMTVTGKLVLVK